MKLIIRKVDLKYEWEVFDKTFSLSGGRDLIKLRRREVTIVILWEDANESSAKASLLDSVSWANPITKNSNACADLDLRYMELASDALIEAISDREFANAVEFDFVISSICSKIAKEYQALYGYAVNEILQGLVAAPFSVSLWAAVESKFRGKCFLAYLECDEVNNSLKKMYLSELDRIISSTLKDSFCQNFNSSIPWIHTVGYGEDPRKTLDIIKCNGATQVKLKISNSLESIKFLIKFCELCEYGGQEVKIYLDANGAFQSPEEIARVLQGPILDCENLKMIEMLGLEEPFLEPFNFYADSLASLNLPIMLDESVPTLAAANEASKRGYGITLKMVRPVSVMLSQVLLACEFSVPLAVQDLTLTGNSLFMNILFRTHISSVIGLEMNHGTFLSQDWIDQILPTHHLLCQAKKGFIDTSILKNSIFAEQ